MFVLLSASLCPSVWNPVQCLQRPLSPLIPELSSFLVLILSRFLCRPVHSDGEDDLPGVHSDPSSPSKFPAIPGLGTCFFNPVFLRPVFSLPVILFLV